MMGKCGQYSQNHDWEMGEECEERGVLVITHGKRVGRIYTVEQAWQDATCKNCSETEKRNLTPQSFEWPRV